LMSTGDSQCMSWKKKSSRIIKGISRSRCGVMKREKPVGEETPTPRERWKKRGHLFLPPKSIPYLERRGKTLVNAGKKKKKRCSK